MENDKKGRSAQTTLLACRHEFLVGFSLIGSDDQSPDGSSWVKLQCCGWFPSHNLRFLPTRTRGAMLTALSLGWPLGPWDILRPPGRFVNFICL